MADWITGTITGNQIGGYVRSCKRTNHVCAPSQTATLLLNPDWPNTITVSDPVTLYEQGVKVLTGYVIRITRARPDYNWEIEINDTYTRATNYFIDAKTVTGYDDNDQPIEGYSADTNYWIGYLAGLCGASYSINSEGHSVPAGVQIGLRSVHESLQDILAYSSQYVKVDADGVWQIGRVHRDSAWYTFDNCIAVTDDTSDEMTRNVVKVYGGFVATRGGQARIFSSASTSVAGITPDRITAVGSPMIQTQAEADRVAAYLLEELGHQTRPITATIQGDPTVRIGRGARIVHGSTDQTDAITSLEAITDEGEGYIMHVTIGERCPRISGWSTGIHSVYAGTAGQGVFRSQDNGANWADFNTGLPNGVKYVTRLAFNYLEEGMVIVNGRLWYTSGEDNRWSLRTLPAPINSAGDSPAPGYGRLVAVDSTGLEGGFAVLTTNSNSSGSDVQQARTWVYETTGSGQANEWTSTELHSSGSVGDTTGSGYHVIGHDLSAQAGAPYAITSSGSVFAGIAGDLWVELGELRRTAVANLSPCISPPPLNTGVVALRYDGADLITGVNSSVDGIYVHFRVRLDQPGSPNTILSAEGRTKFGDDFRWRGGRINRQEPSDDFTNINPTGTGFFDTYGQVSISDTDWHTLTLFFSTSRYSQFFTTRVTFVTVNSGGFGTDVTGEDDCDSSTYNSSFGFLNMAYLNALTIIWNGM